MIKNDIYIFETAGWWKSALHKVFSVGPRDAGVPYKNNYNGVQETRYSQSQISWHFLPNRFWLLWVCNTLKIHKCVCKVENNTETELVHSIYVPTLLSKRPGNVVLLFYFPNKTKCHLWEGTVFKIFRRVSMFYEQPNVFVLTASFATTCYKNVKEAWASAEIFPGGQHQNFAYPFQIADDAMQMAFTKRFNLSTPLVCIGWTSILNFLSEMFSTLRLSETLFPFINCLISIFSSTFSKWVTICEQSTARTTWAVKKQESLTFS